MNINGTDIRASQAVKFASPRLTFVNPLQYACARINDVDAAGGTSLLNGAVFL